MQPIAFLGGHPGLPELLLVLVVILLLFGARRLPDLARALGKSLGEFKRGREEGLKEDLRAADPEGGNKKDPESTREAQGK